MGEHIIKLEKLNKSYRKKRVLQEVSLQIPQGCIFGLLGPSGCGKTTTVKIVAGILNADSGKAVILGKNMPDLTLMSDIGYMGQESALYESLSAYENLMFFGKIYKLKKKELSKQIQYIARLLNLQDDLKKKVCDYSGGMKRRLALGIALLSNPRLLILDEPTVGIDPLLRKSIWEELYKIAESGVTILLTTHVMDEAIKCHRLAMMREGQILAVGTPEEIIDGSGKSDIESAFIFYSSRKQNQTGGREDEG